jgi:hypothetical protein
VISPVDSDDTISVQISGVPGFESVTAVDGATPTVTKHVSTFTYTFNGLSSADLNNGLILNSTYRGKGQPTNPLTVTVSNTTAGESSTAPVTTISVTDPPAGNTSSNNGVGNPVAFTLDTNSTVGYLPNNGNMSPSFGVAAAQETSDGQLKGGAPSNKSSPGLDHAVALFNQYVAADLDQRGTPITNALSQPVTNEEQFLANPHHG